MEILAPAGLLFAVIALPILAMYMLRLRRREVQVSSTMLWSTLLRDRQANTPWQRLKRNLLLFLQLLILAALVASLVRPALAVRTIASGSVVVILDGSASMAAHDIQPNRFEAARAEAERLVDDLQTGARMTVILAAEPAYILANRSTNQLQLRRTLQQVQVSSGSADWQQAFALAAGAASAFQAGEENTIVILSDGGMPVDGLPPLPGTVRYISFGTSSENLAITALDSRAVIGQGGLQLFANVHNFGEQNRRALLSIEVDGKLATASHLTIPAGEDSSFLLDHLPESARVFKAQLSQPDDPNQPLDELNLDDTAFSVNQTAQDRRAFILSQDYLANGNENKFLFEILRVLGITPVTPAVTSPITQTNISATVIPTDTLFNLYVFDGVLPAALPTTGSLLLINPPSNIAGLLSVSEPVTVTGRISLDSTFSLRNPGDELLAGIRWDPVYIARARQIHTDGWSETVISAGDIPLVLRGENRGQKISILAFNLHDSNLPLEIAYPILMSVLLNDLAPSSIFQTPGSSVQPGGSLQILPPPGTTEVVVGEPDQSFLRFRSWNTRIDFTDTSKLGLYTINLLGTGQQPTRFEYFGVNLFNSQESNIKPKPALKIGEANIAVTQPAEISLREIWPWLTALALGLLVLEWFVFHRRGSLPGNTWQSIKTVFNRVSRLIKRKRPGNV